MLGDLFNTSANSPFFLSGKMTITRMHSNRMRTGRSLTLCRSLLPVGGGGGGRGWGWWCWCWWYLSMHQGRPPCGQNHRHEQKYNLGHNFVAAGKNSLFSLCRGNAGLFFHLNSCQTRIPVGCIPPTRCRRTRGGGGFCGQTNTCENITFANFVCGR